MDIGPVGRRFTAEPVHSPVPARDADREPREEAVTTPVAPVTPESSPDPAAARA